MEATNEAIDEQVLLQISDRQFITSKSTLSQKSTFFETLFSNRWNNQRPDGSYFVDADPNLFEHILRYCRRGIFPLFYDRACGHNYSLYLQLLQEARYFGIDSLREWLEEEKYLQAVKIVRSVKSLKAPQSQIREARLANMEQEYFPHWGTRKVFVCPRGVGQHRGNPGLCGKKCVKVQGDEEVIFEDESVLIGLVVVENKVVFDMQQCFPVPQ
ncbi:hypothetical protein BDV38DRAFT_42716 [Aspergillus pseudotamarii]|uniref:BTB domain-containing protein n=1 Tax=Aspergillus pseudotamarii TaxID=132259 RepID=A0A5N6S8D8_ASPPS|nr:uncharacterized protein BDV38DRAFT_42716 [Aspergillus pseudotamarii]KAE8130845.1 hypothetical protein BDV38DRAFT_42716 [Aspergillus pseudotamarii]